MVGAGYEEGVVKGRQHAARAAVTHTADAMYPYQRRNFDNALIFRCIFNVDYRRQYLNKVSYVCGVKIKSSSDAKNIVIKVRKLLAARRQHVADGGPGAHAPWLAPLYPDFHPLFQSTSPRLFPSALHQPTASPASTILVTQDSQSAVTFLTQFDQYIPMKMLSLECSTFIYNFCA